jgi:hypothetical protein
MFSDVVLYVVIERWDAQYMFLTTTVTVAIYYQIRDGKTDDVLWENREQIVYQPDGGGAGNGSVGGLVAQLITKAVVAAMTKAAPNYMPLAHQVNAKALLTYPGTGIPFGPYATEQKNYTGKK